MAEFAQSAEALPLHPTLAAEWFRVAVEAAIPSIGSGGRILDFFDAHSPEEKRLESKSLWRLASPSPSVRYGRVASCVAVAIRLLRV